MTAEELKAYRKAYYEKNKEKLTANKKIYREKTKEARKDYSKAYREKNKEKLKATLLAYDQTPAGKKSKRIRNWKGSGVICDDWDALYEHYINTSFCENCEVELTEGKVRTLTTRCLDHDHKTGLFRNVLCNGCNIRRG